LLLLDNKLLELGLILNTSSVHLIIIWSLYIRSLFKLNLLKLFQLALCLIHL